MSSSGSSLKSCRMVSSWSGVAWLSRHVNGLSRLSKPYYSIVPSWKVTRLGMPSHVIHGLDGFVSYTILSEWVFMVWRGIGVIGLKGGEEVGTIREIPVAWDCLIYCMTEVGFCLVIFMEGFSFCIIQYSLDMSTCKWWKKDWFIVCHGMKGLIYTACENKVGGVGN
jgi:hypothetical protein